MLRKRHLWISTLVTFVISGQRYITTKIERLSEVVMAYMCTKGYGECDGCGYCTEPDEETKEDEE
jgi:hypothetical protein